MADSKFYIVFTDLKGFSALSEQLLIEFEQTINRESARVLKPIIEKAKVFNTWGDATFAAFENGKDAVDYLLAYRAFFNYKKLDGQKLLPRMAAHFGPARLIEDPFYSNRFNLLGKNINATARIEPITRPGEIFVSKDFKEAYEQQCQNIDKIRFDTLGEIKLAKNFGELDIYRLCEKTEEKHVLDKLFAEDIKDYIPEIPEINSVEKELLDNLLTKTNKQLFVQEINDKRLMPEQPSMNFLFGLAKHCKNLGAYDECLTLLDKIELQYLEVEEVPFYPFKHLAEFKKLKANALTRLGKYRDAADIMYGLWHSGAKDTDTLCMLAAQYKRRAIYGEVKDDNKTLDRDTSINKSLLNRAGKLYLEAFRRDINQYYPAINAAYIYIIMKDKYAGKGRQLARYIKQTWSKDKGDNWWLDATLAEAEMLSADIEEAEKDFEQAIKKHTPSAFELSSTYEQIDLYAKLADEEKALRDIFNVILEHKNQQSH